MGDFDQQLEADLAQIESHGLRRRLRLSESPQSAHLRFEGQDVLNFSSNDYLGLADHPQLKAAAIRAVERFGAGSGASRLLSGSLAPHDALEQALAEFKGTEAALSFSSGYATALGTIPALVGASDIVILDRLVHACIVDGARLSGAKLRVFAHNDLNDLERILQWAQSARSAHPPAPARRVLIATESVFSMDGDLAPLRELADLKDKYRAWLMLDEAHATGLYGAGRRGLAEALGVSDRIEIQMGTLGKALGAAGGYICGSRSLVDLLINRARSFVFSTAPVPAASAAAHAGLALIRSEVGRQRCELLWARVREFRAAGCAGVRAGDAASGSVAPAPIIPIPVGDARAAVELSFRLLQQGMYIPAIRYPTVARGKARLRLSLTASHTQEEVTRAVAALQSLSLGLAH